MINIDMCSNCGAGIVGVCGQCGELYPGRLKRLRGEIEGLRLENVRLENVQLKKLGSGDPLKTSSELLNELPDEDTTEPVARLVLRLVTDIERERTVKAELARTNVVLHAMLSRIDDLLNELDDDATTLPVQRLADVLRMPLPEPELPSMVKVSFHLRDSRRPDGKTHDFFPGDGFGFLNASEKHLALMFECGGVMACSNITYEALAAELAKEGRTLMPLVEVPVEESLKDEPSSHALILGQRIHITELQRDLKHALEKDEISGQIINEMQGKLDKAEAEGWTNVTTSEDHAQAALPREFDDLAARMRTPKARAAARGLFAATPEELGEAALAGAEAIAEWEAENGALTEEEIEAARNRIEQREKVPDARFGSRLSDKTVEEERVLKAASAIPVRDLARLGSAMALKHGCGPGAGREVDQFISFELERRIAKADLDLPHYRFPGDVIEIPHAQLLEELEKATEEGAKAKLLTKEQREDRYEAFIRAEGLLSEGETLNRSRRAQGKSTVVNEGTAVAAAERERDEYKSHWQNACDVGRRAEARCRELETAMADLAEETLAAEAEAAQLRGRVAQLEADAKPCLGSS